MEVQLNYEPLVKVKGIFCHLLTIKTAEKHIKIVVDCGIQKSFDFSIYSPETREIIKKADFILITSYDLSHFGAVGLFNTCKIYCTVPTAVIGKILLDNAQEKIATICENQPVINDINLIMIKYSQPFEVVGLEISAYNSGNVIGNALYKINDGFKTYSVGYNLNHKKENLLDGLTDFFNSDVFITNCSYVLSRETSLKDRNETFAHLIQNTSGKVIFVVNAARLIELLLTIQQKVCVVTNISLMDRIKSMIEWAGTNGVKIADMQIPFCKVSEINKKVVVVISDYFNDVYLASVLKQHCNKNDALVFLNTDLIPEQLPYYEIAYKTQSRAEKEESSEESSEETVVKETDESLPWYEKTGTLLAKDIKKMNMIVRFQKYERKEVVEDYGEVIDFDFGTQMNANLIIDELHSMKESEEVEIEEIQLKDETVKIKDASKSIFLGICGLKGFKEVFEEFTVKNMILVPENEELGEIMYQFIKTAHKNVFMCNKKVEIKLENRFLQFVDLNEHFFTQKFYPISKKYISIFVSKIVDNKLIFDDVTDENEEADFKEERPVDETIESKKHTISYNDEHHKKLKKSHLIKKQSVCLTDININSMKRLLNDHCFTIEVVNEGIIVNGECTIKIQDEELTLESKDSGLLASVREVLFKSLIIFNETE
ncbi:cft2 [Nucleospora cyclopteri]